ncbi:MAG TPA: MurT ligase domain-containing protein [Patescibacteria group bacterium]|jgi:UDP-N-acetylmuramyl tripeptide synthase|nr:MurT ligase domain-containing protein [Patescibacteria group bacterium]
MRTRSTVAVGKTIKQLMRLRGGGSALPGLVAERIDPDFMRRCLAQLPHGVVLISGTNGKTTTTKMVVELLESQNLKVFTNRTGSNFTRGVTAALLGEVNSRGELDADIAVLELDEAHAVHFVRRVKPTYSLFLNVLRDQLDRFGEIDHTAQLLRKIAEATTDGIVLNRDDPRLGAPAFIKDLTVKSVRTYGVSTKLLQQFPSDEQMRDADAVVVTSHHPTLRDDTSLEAIRDTTAAIQFGSTTHEVTLKLKGIYNIQNAVGAIALVRMIMGKALQVPAMLSSLAAVEPAFGRGETIMVDGTPLELVLVKNPSGFRLSLSSFNPEHTATMVAINDNYADGRDMSWLWDVDFDRLKAGVDVIGGIRAYDMALRLQYDEIEVRHVEVSLPRALREFLAHNTDQAKRIYCTYTAMLQLRRELSKIADVKVVS